MNPSLKRTINRTFLQLIEDLKDKEEIQILLQDLMGEKEYEDIVKKLAIIYWLRKERPKDVIQNNVGVSLNYINSIDKIMDKKGIKLAIKYMEAEEFANVWVEKIKNFNK